MKVQQVSVTNKDDARIVDLLIADNEDLDAANEIIQIVVPVQLGEYPRLVEVELAALDRVRDVIGNEIRQRKSAAGRDY